MQWRSAHLPPCKAASASGAELHGPRGRTPPSTMTRRCSYCSCCSRRCCCCCCRRRSRCCCCCRRCLRRGVCRPPSPGTCGRCGDDPWPHRARHRRCSAAATRTAATAAAAPASAPAPVGAPRRLRSRRCCRSARGAGSRSRTVWAHEVAAPLRRWPCRPTDAPAAVTQPQPHHHRRRLLGDAIGAALPALPSRRGAAAAAARAASPARDRGARGDADLVVSGVTTTYL